MDLSDAMYRWTEHKLGDVFTIDIYYLTFC